MFPLRSTVPTRYPAVMTWLLIAANCVIFLYEISLPAAAQEQFILRYALIPTEFLGPSARPFALLDGLPFLTNTFLHGGWLHLILNMWTLWIFAPAIEDRFGPIRFLIFYLLCGVLASLTHAVFNAGSEVPALGASGAIAGVLGCYARMFPFSRVIILVPILFLPLFFEVYAIFFISLWFLAQLFQGTAELFSAAHMAGIAWWAHVGGFAAGLILANRLAPPARSYRQYYGDEGIFGFTPDGHR
jgi:membrane associated rhomboid family serine protease